MNKGNIPYHRFDLLLDYSLPVRLVGYMSDEVGAAEIADFLSKNGAMGVLLMIDKEDGTKHTDFKHNLHVSRATVTKRLNNADELDLMEVSRLPDDHGNVKRYALTELGRVLRVALESKGLVEIYQQYVELEQVLEDANEEMVEWVKDTDEIWAEKKFASEFTFREEFQKKETFPGDDVPDGFIEYIEGELSKREKAEKALERERKKSKNRLGGAENPPDSDGNEGDEG